MKSVKNCYCCGKSFEGNTSYLCPDCLFNMRVMMLTKKGAVEQPGNEKCQFCHQGGKLYKLTKPDNSALIACENCIIEEGNRKEIKYYAAVSQLLSEKLRVSREELNVLTVQLASRLENKPDLAQISKTISDTVNNRQVRMPTRECLDMAKEIYELTRR